MNKRPHDFTRFDRLMSELKDWRQDDHEDNKLLCRSYVIDILEGVAAVRAENDRLRSIEERAKLVISEWARYGRGVAEPLGDQLEALRDLLNDGPLVK